MIRLKRYITKKSILLLICLVTSCHFLLHTALRLFTSNEQKTIAKKSEFPQRTFRSSHFITKTTTISHENTTSFTTQILWKYPLDNPSYFFPRQDKVTPLDFNIVLPSEGACADPPFLLILVLTVHEHVEEREVIRRTWGGVAYGRKWPRRNISQKIKIVFLLAETSNQTIQEQIQKESQKHQDIVVFGFQESYYNLTYKVLMGFKWVKEFCPQARFVMKIDEDSFVDIPKVIDRLHTAMWNSSICGYYFKNDKAYRIGKYKVSRKVYPFVYYPPHVKGNAYFMPTNFALRLLNVSEYLPFLNMEDVHITGVLAMAARVNRYKAFAPEEFSPWGMIPECDFSHSPLVVSAFVRPQFARDLWTRMQGLNVCKNSKHFLRVNVFQ